MRDKSGLAWKHHIYDVFANVAGMLKAGYQGFTEVSRIALQASLKGKNRCFGLDLSDNRDIVGQ